MKKCKKCSIEKPLSEYHKRGKGFRPRCKTCMCGEQKQYYQNNKQICDEKAMTYYYKNKEAILLQQKEYQKERKKLDK